MAEVRRPRFELDEREPMSAEDRVRIADLCDSLMWDAYRIKAQMLEYPTPTCANVDHHPHGSAGQCLALP